MQRKCSETSSPCIRTLAIWCMCVVWRCNVITKEIKFHIKPWLGMQFSVRIGKYGDSTRAREYSGQTQMDDAQNEKAHGMRSYFLISGPGDIKCFMKSHKLSLSVFFFHLSSLASIWGEYHRIKPQNIQCIHILFPLVRFFRLFFTAVLTPSVYFIRITRIKYV